MKLTENFGDSVVVLSNLMVFKTETAKMLHLAKLDDDLDAAIEKVAIQVISELSSRKRQNVITITSTLTMTWFKNQSVRCLMTLLGKISTQYHNSPSALLIGNIVTSIINCQPSDLQIAFGIEMRQNKCLFNLLSAYNVCCSYGEVELFKYSSEQ